MVDYFEVRKGTNGAMSGSLTVLIAPLLRLPTEGSVAEASNGLWCGVEVRFDQMAISGPGKVCRTSWKLTTVLPRLYEMASCSLVRHWYNPNLSDDCCGVFSERDGTSVYIFELLRNDMRVMRGKTERERER